jgi:ATP-dependent 26S proteasome regulatory subunit
MSQQVTESSADQQRLHQLFRAEHPCIAIHTFEEDDALQLVRDTAIEMGSDLWVWSISTGLRDGLIAGSRPVPDTEHPAAALYHLAQGELPTLVVMLDLCGHLKDERTMRLCRELIQKFTRTGAHLVLIDHQPQLPPALRAAATEFELSLPDEKELEQIIRQTLRQRNEICRIQVQLTRSELNTIIRNLQGLTRRQARQVVLDSICEDHSFTIADLNTILAKKRKHLEGAGVLEYVEAPVDLGEIGGLDRLKGWLEQRRNALSDEAVKFGLTPPRGVLMLGVQGAGKSLSAKAVATAWQRPLLKMDAGALYDRYIGESERRLRDSLHQAEMMAPVILWIDEIEKAFASAASHSADGGLSKRMFGTLLTWMQEHRAPVFLIATANDIEALPPELLRKGRFDEIFFVDLPTDTARRKIFEIHLKRRGRNPDRYNVAELSEAADGFSGAEIEQAVISAMHSAFAEKSDLTMEHLLEALRTSPPLSVTMAEKVHALRRWSHGRCVPAD